MMGRLEIVLYVKNLENNNCSSFINDIRSMLSDSELSAKEEGKKTEIDDYLIYEMFLEPQDTTFFPRLIKKLKGYCNSNHMEMEAIEHNVYGGIVNYISTLTSESFNNVCQLYINNKDKEKLYKLLKHRARWLLLNEEDVDEVFNIYKSIGDYENAQELLIDTYDYLHATYGENYNYTSLAKLFIEIGDFNTAKIC